MKIRAKLILTYAGLSILLLVGADIGISLKLEEFFRNRLEQESLRMIDGAALLLEQTSPAAPAVQDSVMRRFAASERIRLTVVRADGSVLLDSDVPFSQLASVENHARRPEILEAARQGIGKDIRHSATVGRDFLYVAARKDLPGSRNGFIRVSVHLEDLQSSIREIRWNIALAGSAVLLLVLLVSSFISYRLSGPMIAIAKDAEAIRNGDLSRRIHVATHDEAGQVAQAVNALVDALNADIVKLQKLERVRTEFLGNVSHELRTPLFSLQGYLETLLDGAIGDPAVNTLFVQKALHQAQRLNLLLQDLIDISRIESGEMKMSFRFFRLQDFLEHAGEDAEGTARTSGIRIVIEDLLPSDTEVFGDKERLRQALDNLIDNAVKYNRPEGNVTVRALPDPAGVRIEVADTGVGIAAAHLPRLFERFYRVDKDRSREVGGTGLGLAIVKHILEAHHSSVRVTSEPGTGSCFSFVLSTELALPKKEPGNSGQDGPK